MKKIFTRWHSDEEVQQLKTRIQDLEALIGTYSGVNIQLREENDALSSAIIWQSFAVWQTFGLPEKN